MFSGGIEKQHRVVMGKPNLGVWNEPCSQNRIVWFFLKKFKGCLLYKTIFCHKVAFDAQLMNCLFEIK